MLDVVKSIIECPVREGLGEWDTALHTYRNPVLSHSGQNESATQEQHSSGPKRFHFYTEWSVGVSILS